MTPQVDTKSMKPTAPPVEDAPVFRKVSVVYFRESVMFGSELHSASVTAKGQTPNSNAVDTIRLAWLNADGEIDGAPQGRTADGLALAKRVHNLHNGKRYTMQSFVPWSNVRSLTYGE